MADFPVNEAILSIIMNDCMWSVIWLSKLMNHQNHKTQTIIEAEQSRLQDIRNVAGEFYWIFIVADMQNRILENIVSVGATNRESTQN